MTEVADLLARHKALKSARGQWESLWQELAEVLLPNRANFTTPGVPGEKKTDRIYDSTPMLARRGLASAVDGLLKPPTSQWFHIRAEDEELNDDDEVKAWLGDVERRIFNAIYDRRAKFIRRSGEADNDLVTFGTGILFTGENRQLDGLRFRAIPLSDGLIAENEDGEVDTIFIESRLSARQAAQRFGDDNLGVKTLEALRDGKPDEKFPFLQIVLPRGDHDPRRADAANMPFATIDIDVQSEHLAGEGGFHEFPFAVPRWDTSSGEIYGRSPGTIALPDANTLQAMGKTLLVAGQKAVDPPLVTVADAIIGAPLTFPGGITYADSEAWRELGGRAPVQPLHTGANIPLGREMEQDKRDQIFAAFFRNVLNLPVDSPQMTATEILERKEEFIRTIGPTFGQLEADYIGHIPERAFNIMKRARQFPAAPEILQGREVRFEYRSPVQQAKRQIEAAGVARSMELLAPFVAADPAIMDNFDGDEIARDVPDIFGTPLKWLRPKEQVEGLRESRAQASQAQALLDGGEQLTNIAKNLPDGAL